MQKKLQIWTLVLVLFSSFFGHGCLDEEIQSTTRGGMDLRVILPEPVVKNPMGRSGATDFDKINDINVVIASDGSDDATIECLYFSGTNTDGEDPRVNFGKEEIIVHFSKEYVSQEGLASKTIYIVANYGDEIDKNKVKNVSDLKSITEEANQGIPVGCMMFAKAENDGTHQDGNGDTGTRLSAKLERTVAMITVEINGKNLAKNVSITPRAISLHRVPSKCFIGKENLIVATDVVENGETKGDRGELDWGILVGDNTTVNENGLTPWGGGPAKTVVGGHYADDYSSTEIAPLFMFENYHGDGFGSSEFGEEGKRPVACVATTPEGIHKDPSTQTCSYLEVEAYYLRMNDEGTASLYSGIVRFRFFLGENEIDNFDVMRNTYYKVTLELSGYAVSEGGQINTDGSLKVDGKSVTWRVETELGQASFGVGDIILNGSGEYFPIDLEVAEDAIYTIEGSMDNVFLYIYDKKQGGQWNSVAGRVESTIVNGQIWIYAMPWSKGVGTWDDDHSRTQTITLTAYKGSISESNKLSTSVLTVVQYAPIEYTTPTDDPATVEFIEKVFNGKKSVTLLIDRVDREAMPWGFDGVVLDHNSNDGFHNAFHLIDPNPKDHPGRNHREEAQKYLPWGKMNGGSAMIYSMSFWHMPDASPDIDIESMISAPSFPDYTTAPDWSDNYWTLPSIVGWQIIEKASIAGELDAKHPIVTYLPYWTSNASTLEGASGTGDDGATSAYTYQFNKGLHTLKEGDDYDASLVRPRTDKYRFRLIAVQPN